MQDAKTQLLKITNNFLRCVAV